VQRDRSLGDGVYYRAEDYVGFSPRILILVVDTLVLVAIVCLVACVWGNMVGDYNGVFAGTIALAIWLYVVPLKRSAFRTIGYRLTGAKLVTLTGQRPSLFMLTFRSLLWILGPCNILFDLIWCGVDDDRQTMRDRFTSMCLVRNRADPIGTGEVHLAYFNAFGYTLAYPHVVHPKTAGP
jgi:uncharacterized RDD family membrane protein YckC